MSRELTREKVLASINRLEKLDTRLKEPCEKMRILFIREDDKTKRRERTSVENKTIEPKSNKACVPSRFSWNRGLATFCSIGNPLVKSLLEALNILLNPWLWLPAVFTASMLVSLYLAISLGYIGFFLGYSWVYPLVIREGLRRLRKKPKSEFWETSEERFQKAIRELAKSKPAPP